MSNVANRINMEVDTRVSGHSIVKLVVDIYGDSQESVQKTIELFDEIYLKVRSDLTKLCDTQAADERERVAGLLMQEVAMLREAKRIHIEHSQPTGAPALHPTFVSLTEREEGLKIALGILGVDPDAPPSDDKAVANKRRTARFSSLGATAR